MSYLIARADDTKHYPKRGDLRMPRIADGIMQITKVAACQKMKNCLRIVRFIHHFAESAAYSL